MSIPQLPNKNVSVGNLFEGDKVIWMILFFLCIISILEVYSASSTMTFGKSAYWQPVLMHSLYLAVGVGLKKSLIDIIYRCAAVHGVTESDRT